MDFPGKSTVYFNHGIDSHFQKRRLSPATLTKDEFAVWSESILRESDEYEKFLIELGKQGKLGMSSGVPGHLVEREPAGKGTLITYWPLGKDASFTHTPAEPKTRNLIPLKSLIEITPTQTAEPVTVASVEPEPLPAVIGDTKMATLEELETKVAELTATIENAPAVKSAPAYLKAPLGDDGIKAFVNWSRTGDRSGLKLVDWQEGAATEGGVVVPDEFYARIIEKRDVLSAMRAAGAPVLTISRDKITIPTEGTREAAFVATDEEGTYDAGNTAPLAQLDIAPHKYTRVTKVAEELLADAAVDIVGFLASRYARAVATLENTLFMSGTDDGDPSAQGIVAGGTAGLSFAGGHTVTAAEVVNLFYKLGAQYTDGAAWFMRQATLGVIMGLASSSVFTFMQTPAGSIQPQILGKPVYANDGMAALGHSAKSIAIGNPEFYQIVQRGTMVVNRNPFLYMANGQVGFFASVRISGAVTQAEAFQYGTNATA
jgi:HK97 family phage major capsid protein